MEFPIDKKLFHLVLDPGKSRCPTVDLELIQTMTIRETCKLDTKFRSEIPTGKTGPPF